MARVYIAQNIIFLKKIYQKIALDQSHQNKCLILDDISLGDEYLSLDQNIEIIRRESYDEQQRETFLKAYVDLIGALGSELDSLLWWATDISSKNRFMSKFPQLLQQYVEIVTVVRDEDYQSLIILNPMVDLLPSLKKYLEENNIPFISFEASLRNWLRRKIFLCKKVLSIFYNAARFYLRGAWARLCLGRGANEQMSPRRPYYVIKTFVYDNTFRQDSGYQDPFFGSLLEFLKAKKDIIIFADILGNFKFCIKKIKECRNYCIIPIETYVTLSDILKGVAAALTYRIKPRKGVSFLGRDITKLLNDELRKPYAGIQIGQLLHYWGMKRFCRRFFTETFLSSYENNPWEKMCIWALREDSPGTKVIGYQHNVIPQASANMFISSKELKVIPRPHTILTTGDIPKDIMERYGSLNGECIKSSCALRHEYLFCSGGSRRRKIKTVLLALEGIVEVYKLVNAFLDELRDNNKYYIIIRTHPALPIRYLRHKLKWPMDPLGNAVLSQNVSLKHDIERADVVVYWGSTVGLEALWMGKPVIHYDMGHMLSYDPLFECRHLKWRVGPGDSFAAVLDQIDSLSEQEFEQHKIMAQLYLRRYFHPNSKENLEKFIFP